MENLHFSHWTTFENVKEIFGDEYNCILWGQNETLDTLRFANIFHRWRFWSNLAFCHPYSYIALRASSWSIENTQFHFWEHLEFVYLSLAYCIYISCYLSFRWSGLSRLVLSYELFIPNSWLQLISPLRSGSSSVEGFVGLVVSR